MTRGGPRTPAGGRPTIHRDGRRIDLLLAADLLAAMDSARGEESRPDFIRRAIAALVAATKKNRTRKVDGG